MKKENIFYVLITLAILIRIPLLFLNPISMWADPVCRFIPNTYNILEGNLSFYTPPLLMIMNAFPVLFLEGVLLEIVWKIIPFIFFILSCFVFVKILNMVELEKFGKILLLCLFLFSVYSILFSTTIMLEMLVLFFTLCLFYLLEKNEKIGIKLFFIIAILSALLLYSKQTGYFILAGFFLYVLFKKIDPQQKRLILMALFLGFLINCPWIIKNNLIYGGFFSSEVSETSGNLFEISENLPLLISNTFHYIYRIPPLSKLNYSGIFFIFSRIYYFAFFISSIIFSSSILLAMVKFSKEYKKYLLMVLPILLFSFWWAFLYPSHNYNDFGRFMFSFYFLFFFFGLKYIEGLKNINLKRLFYLSIILLCLLSIVTSFAASVDFNKRDDEIRDLAEFVKDKEGIFISNDMFTSTVLRYYSDKEIEFLLEENKIDRNIKCGEEIVYSSKRYKVSLEGQRYEICKI